MSSVMHYCDARHVSRGGGGGGRAGERRRPARERRRLARHTPHHVITDSVTHLAEMTWCTAHTDRPTNRHRTTDTTEEGLWAFRMGRFRRCFTLRIKRTRLDRSSLEKECSSVPAPLFWFVCFVLCLCVWWGVSIGRLDHKHTASPGRVPVGPTSVCLLVAALRLVVRARARTRRQRQQQRARRATAARRSPSAEMTWRVRIGVLRDES